MAKDYDSAIKEFHIMWDSFPSLARLITEGACLNRLLKCMSKFHRYSINNSLLIAMQCPNATLVAGYQAWEKNHGRHVRKRGHRRYGLR